MKILLTQVDLMPRSYLSMSILYVFETPTRNIITIQISRKLRERLGFGQ